MKKYSIIIPAEVRPGPSHKELSAARILLEYFEKDIIYKINRLLVIDKQKAVIGIK